MDLTALTQIIDSYKDDPESVYNTWFDSSAQRMNAFRAIRQGVCVAIERIANKVKQDATVYA